jgi:hypothetical protein
MKSTNDIGNEGFKGLFFGLIDFTNLIILQIAY